MLSKKIRQEIQERNLLNLVKCGELKKTIEAGATDLVIGRALIGVTPDETQQLCEEILQNIQLAKTVETQENKIQEN